MEQVHADKLDPKSAVPIFQQAVRTGPLDIPAVFVRLYIRFALSKYLNIAVGAPLEKCKHEVLTHPVFLVQSALEHAGKLAREASL